jgi:magnesium-transporting ATPase (P-type)
MLTGDKGETALQIGLSCGLYDKTTLLFKLDSDEDENAAEQLQDIAKKISEAELKTCFAICGSCLPPIF